MQSADTAIDILAPPILTLGMAGLVLFITMPVAVMAGFWFGQRRRAQHEASQRVIDPKMGEAVQGAFLALLGLLLAFAFGSALTFANDRKAAIVVEAAAINTAFQRADFLPDPGRTELQSAILDYARSRVPPPGADLRSFETIRDLFRRSTERREALWPVLRQATGPDVPAPTRNFVASGITEITTAHYKRMMALSSPISNVANLVLYLAAMTAVFLMGNRSAYIGHPLTWRSFVFTGFLLFVMITILDTQRASEGAVIVDVSALYGVIDHMERVLASR